MTRKAHDPVDFFARVGEIWVNICLIEFLMRCAIAQKEGDISKLPKPPFLKGQEYNTYPESFALYSFDNVADRFVEVFPEISISQDLRDLRNAMAHGLVTEINNSGVDELIKLRRSAGVLKVEFSMALDKDRLEKINKEIRDLRRTLGREAADR